MKISKVKIVSYSMPAMICDPMHEDMDDDRDSEQHLILSRDGRYWLSRYNCSSDENEDGCYSKAQGSVFHGKEEKIFELLEKYCQEYKPEPMWTDCGSWEMTTYFDDGSEKEFSFSKVDKDSILYQVSEMIRTELDLFDLYLFDFNTSCPQYDNGPIAVFDKYLPLLYENTFLWNRFLELSRQYFRDSREDFFAFSRDRRCIGTWRAFLDNMGGGVQIFYFQAAAFIILAYKNSGHDIDAELADIQDKYADEFV